MGGGSWEVTLEGGYEGIIIVIRVLTLPLLRASPPTHSLSPRSTQMHITTNMVLWMTKSLMTHRSDTPAHRLGLAL